MLSEAEQRQLIEIENQLRADDPTFAQRFGDHGQHRPRPRWHGAAIAVAVATVAVGLMVHSVGLVVVALTVIGASAGLWITNRIRP
jgi:hypothetical protein